MCGIDVNTMIMRDMSLLSSVANACEGERIVSDDILYIGVDDKEKRGLTFVIRSNNDAVRILKQDKKTDLEMIYFYDFNKKVLYKNSVPTNPQNSYIVLKKLISSFLDRNEKIYAYTRREK